MTARTPHTPIWRRFISLPTTRLGWYSLGFLGAHALVMVALGILSGVLAATGAPNLAGHPWLIGAVLFAALSPAFAWIVTGLIALLRSQEEHSVLVWLAMVPAALLTVIPIVFMAQFVSYQVSHTCR